MSKPIPLQFGVTYHIYNRGNNRQPLFFEEENYRYFLRLYAKHIEPVADTFAYCLLGNHFHLLVRIMTEDEQREQAQARTRRVSGGKSAGADVGQPVEVLQPSQQFGNLFNAYSKAINNRYRRTGSLFEHPFERIPVTSEAYFQQLVIYIHQNPQKHGLVDDFREWPYSSYHALVSQSRTRLKRETVLAWFDGQESLVAAHQQMTSSKEIEPLLLEDFE